MNITEFLSVKSRYGDGDGDGYGYGYGYGDGLKSLNNQTIYLIDNLQIIISNIRNNIAKGFIVQDDLSLTPCFIVKGENNFAHGSTLRDAFLSLQKKNLLTLSVSERIIKFKSKFNKLNKKYPALELYEWHHLLTGSCDLGRKSFCKEKNINIKKDLFTISEFIKLTKNSYGADIIKQL